jgi:Uma2 family endonuclease
MALQTPTSVASAAPVAGDPDVPDTPIYRLSVAQYHAMAAAGILTENDPVELLEGWLVRKMTKHRPHSRATLRTRRALEGALPAGWYVDTQEPITTLDSEPEPDVLVLRGEEADYPDRHPGPADVALVVEVADSSLAYDRGTKKRIYARAGITVYWIVNLIERQVEVYSDPTGPAEAPDYREQHTHGLSDTVPVMLDGLEAARLPVTDLLP